VNYIYRLHKIGIAHCDISTENICIEFIDNKPNLTLIDFGLSRIHPSSSLNNMIDSENYLFSGLKVHYNKSIDTFIGSIIPNCKRHGKITYISPERHEANTYYGTIYDLYKDDVYSLGVILHSMLLGYPPFMSPVLNDSRFMAYLNGSWKIRLTKEMKHISHHAIDLIDKILKFENNRCTLDDIVNHPWLN